MVDDLSAAMHTQHEDPTSEAAASVATYLTVAIAAAQAAVNRAAARTQTAADDQDGGGVEAARGVYAVMLARDKGRQAPAGLALAAWQAAQPWRQTARDADKAARRAQDRLRVLHPDAMARYDALRRGLDPVAAMREVAPLIAAEIAHPTARADFAPMLTTTEGSGATSAQALTAWTAALPLTHLPDAQLAAARAQARLRVLHPAAMDRYDVLRTAHTPLDAARAVAAQIDPAAPATAAQAAPVDRGVASLPVASAADVVPVEAYAAAARQALPAELATAVLTDPAWPQLADALHRAEQAGADPAVLLAEAAGRRELGSAASPAQVLTYRLSRPADQQTSGPVDQPAVRPADQQTEHKEQAPRSDQVTTATEDRQTSGTGVRASDPARIAAQSFPTPLAQPPASERRDGGLDVAAASAGHVLAREADALADASRDAASTPDDVWTPRVDEHQEGIVTARPLQTRAAADDARAHALLTQADQSTRQAPGTNVMPVFSSPPSPQAAAAAQSFPTPLAQASPPTGRATTPPSAARVPNRVTSRPRRR